MGDEVVEEMAERLNALAESAGTETAPADEGTPAPAGETPPAASPAEVEIDGEKLTYDQIRELKRSPMLLADYTRKTQALAEQRRKYEQYEQERAEFNRQREEWLARTKPAGPSPEEAAARQEEEMELSPAMRRVLERERAERAALAQRVEKYEQTKAEEAQQAEQARVNTFIVENAEHAIKGVMAEHKIPDSLLPLVKSAIAMEDPDMADPATGSLTKDSITAAIRQTVPAVIKSLLEWKNSVASTTVKDLKKEPAKTGAAAPGLRPAAPAPAGNGKDKQKVWDDDETITQIMDRMSAASGGSGEYAP